MARAPFRLDRWSIITALLLGLGFNQATAQEKLTNATVIEMVEAGLDEALIIDNIKTTLTEFLLEPSEQVKLARAKVSTTVIQAMRESKLRGGAPERAQTVTIGYALPTAYGIYRVDGNRLIPIEADYAQSFPVLEMVNSRAIETQRTGVSVASGFRTQMPVKDAEFVAFVPNASYIANLRLIHLEVGSLAARIGGKAFLLADVTPTEVAPIATDPRMVRLHLRGDVGPGTYALQDPADARKLYPISLYGGNIEVPIFATPAASKEAMRLLTESPASKVSTSKEAALRALEKVFENRKVKLAGGSSDGTVFVSTPAHRKTGLFGDGEAWVNEFAARIDADQDGGSSLRVVARSWKSGIPAMNLSKENWPSQPKMQDIDESRKQAASFLKDWMKEASK